MYFCTNKSIINMKVSKFIFLLLALFNGLKVTPQEMYTFKNIGAYDGLSDNTIFDITKDSYAFMWFGTGYGLNRYDGYKITEYRKSKNDGKILYSNSKVKIQEDGDANLWVEVNDNHFLYNREKDFFHSDVFTKLKELGIDVKKIALLHVDFKKDLWLYDNNRLFYFSFANRKLKVFSKQNSSSSLGQYKISAIQSRDNKVFIIYKSGLIECIDSYTGKLLWRNEKLAFQFLSIGVNFNAYLDSTFVLWIYTEGRFGIWRLNTDNGTWDFFGTQSSSNRLSDNVIRDILEDEMGNVWIATEYSGVNIYNVKTKKISYLKHRINDNTSIATNNTASLYLDNLNTMWIGLFRKGISYVCFDNQKFETRYLGDKSNVNSFSEDESGSIFFGTNGSGLVKLDKSSKMTSVSSSSGNVIVCQYLDSKSRLWIGYYMGDVCCFKDGKFEYVKLGSNADSPMDNSVWAINEDKRGNIWLGTLRNGLYRYNPESKRIDSYKNKSSILPTNTISDLVCNRTNRVYIGTTLGLYEFDVTRGVLKSIKGNVSGTQMFADSMITCLYKDSRELLWVGTPSGLAIFDEKKDSIVYLNTNNGLSGNHVRGIVEDDNKNMWVTTNNGITNISVQRYSKVRKFTFDTFCYNEEDGLQGTDFNEKAIYKTRNGDIYVGGPSGYNVITPKLLNNSQEPPKVIFTGLNIYNKNILVDSTYNNHLILKKSIYLTNEIELKYSDNSFFIEFSAMNYINSSKIRYAYKLKEQNSDWIYLNNNNKVYFTNLNSGTYTLLVKAANKNGYWSDVASSIVIHIKPPFWLSIYAYVFYSLVLFGLAFLGYNYSRKKLRLKMKDQRSELELVKRREMDEMRLRFFTNISHDFRTPLSLIISPIEKMINDSKDESVVRKLKIIYQSANTLLNLVNQLLDFRKLDVKAEVLNLSHGDIISFINDICRTFEIYSERKNMTLTVKSDVKKLEMVFDKDKIHKIMMNLLSNAFKYSNVNGAVFVNIGLVDNGSFLSVQVIDEGIGISDDDKLRIFERFFQVSQSKVNFGSGIGLHIAKEYVELHQGEIQVTDNVPHGSVFTFKIPIRDYQDIDGDFEDNNIEEIEHSETEPSASLSNKSVVLIVEDNDNFRTFLMDCLSDSYEVLDAANGKKAVSILRNKKVDIVISDVMMPVMNGLELCNFIKHDINYSHIPVILLTARTAEEHVLEGLNEGADDYIAKPFNIDILKIRIDKFLDWNKKSHDKFRSIDVSPTEITICSLDEQFIAKAIKAVEDNISNPNLSVAELSSIVGMSRGCLYKKILFITGKTPIEFIHIMRTKLSVPLLLKSQMNISEIAYKVGYNSPKVYAKYFKSQFNMTPSEYIKSHSNENK